MPIAVMIFLMFLFAAFGASAVLPTIANADWWSEEFQEYYAWDDEELPVDSILCLNDKWNPSKPNSMEVEKASYNHIASSLSLVSQSPQQAEQQVVFIKDNDDCFKLYAVSPGTATLRYAYPAKNGSDMIERDFTVTVEGRYLEAHISGDCPDGSIGYEEENALLPGDAVEVQAIVKQRHCEFDESYSREITGGCSTHYRICESDVDDASQLEYAWHLELSSFGGHSSGTPEFDGAASHLGDYATISPSGADASHAAVRFSDAYAADENFRMEVRASVAVSSDTGAGMTEQDREDSQNIEMRSTVYKLQSPDIPANLDVGNPLAFNARIVKCTAADREGAPVDLAEWRFDWSYRCWHGAKKCSDAMEIQSSLQDPLEATDELEEGYQPKYLPVYGSGTTTSFTIKRLAYPKGNLKLVLNKVHEDKLLFTISREYDLLRLNDTATNNSLAHAEFASGTWGSLTPLILLDDSEKGCHGTRERSNYPIYGLTSIYHTGDSVSMPEQYAQLHGGYLPPDSFDWVFYSVDETAAGWRSSDLDGTGIGYTELAGAPSEVGRYAVSARGIGGYTGESDKTEFVIISKDSAPSANLEEAEVSFEPSSCVYDGAEQKPQARVMADGVLLTPGVDYLAYYSDNVDAGTAQVDFEAFGKCFGETSANFEIAKASIGDATVSGVSAKTYTGSAIVQETPTVMFNGRNLAKGTDYTVSYKDNVDAGEATMTLTGSGANFSGTAEVKFAIGKASIANASVSALGAKTYTGKGQIQNPTVKLGQKTLSDADYSVSYANNVNAGTATMTLTGKGRNLTGTKKMTFAINKAQISKASTSGIVAKTYTGSAVTLAPAATFNGRKLVQGTDYTLSYKNNVNAGNATVTFIGKGNFTGTLPKGFAISKAAMNKTAIQGIVSKTYNGKAITLNPTVKFNGKKLASGSDYAVSYKNNVNAGNATVTFAGKGNFSGSISKAFKINKAANPMSVKVVEKGVKVGDIAKKTKILNPISLTRKAQGAVSYAKTGGAACLSVAKTTGLVNVKRGTPKGTYSINVSIKAAGNKNYNAMTKTVKVTIKVK